MVDTIGLGPIALKSVEVQVLSSAPALKNYASCVTLE